MREFPTVYMQDLMTPWKRALRAALGPVDSSLISDMDSLDYDHAPVMIDHKSIGVISKTRLRELATTGLPLAADDDAIVTSSVVGLPELDEALAAVQEHGVASIGLGTWMNSTGAGGFYTLSDLNKHPVRAAIYPLFAELESELATCAARHFSDPWVWLVKLDRDKQARLVGYWELSKREKLDVGPIAGTTLSELSKIVGLAEPLRVKLGFASKGKWDEFFGGLVDLRNGIMHPVRPLFTSLDDLQTVREQLERVLTLLDRLDEEEK